jgi:hypothetical protein
MAREGEAVRSFLPMFAVISFHHPLLNYVCLSVKVSKSAPRSYNGLTLIHLFIMQLPSVTGLVCIVC